MDELKTNESRQCSVCGSDHFNPWRFGFFRCNGCGLVLSPEVWQQDVNDQKNDEWFGDEYERRKSSVWVEWFEAHNNRRTLARLKHLPMKGKRLLEIGVGNGSFLGAAQRAGFEPMGCDLSVAICRQLERNHGMRMHCGTLDTLSEGARFDIVIINHVLEHVEDPLVFLWDVRRLLSPGGFVHIAVPNIACSESNLSGWTSYEPYRLVYHDRETLRRACLVAELRIISVMTHESFNGWFLAGLRTVLGVKRLARDGVSMRPSDSGDAAQGNRWVVVENAYRAVMTLMGGGAMAFATGAVGFRFRRRVAVHRMQADWGG